MLNGASSGNQTAGYTAVWVVCVCVRVCLYTLLAGSPGKLEDMLSSNVNPYGLAVDWDGIRDSVLDMATYCCSALADPG